MLQEGIAVARQPIPVGGGDVGDAFDDLVVDGDGRRLARPA